MSPDPRIARAREYLTGARRRKAASLPDGDAQREAAELRRHLGGLLDLISETGISRRPSSREVSRAREDIGGFPTDPQLTRASQPRLVLLASRMHWAAMVLDSALRQAGPGAGSYLLDSEDVTIVRDALHFGISLRLLNAAAWCRECTTRPEGVCDEHSAEIQALNDYRHLLERIERPGR
jgi:hypothetical protein